MKNSDTNIAKLKSLLESKGLEHCIPLLEEKKLLIVYNKVRNLG